MREPPVRVRERMKEGKQVGHFEVVKLETSWWGRVGRGDGGYPYPRKVAQLHISHFEVAELESRVVRWGGVGWGGERKRKDLLSV